MSDPYEEWKREDDARRAAEDASWLCAGRKSIDYGEVAVEGDGDAWRWTCRTDDTSPEPVAGDDAASAPEAWAAGLDALASIAKNMELQAFMTQRRAEGAVQRAKAATSATTTATGDDDGRQ